MGAIRLPLVKPALTDSTLRNDLSNWLGFRFTVGSTPLTVTSLGRWVVSGNIRSHLVIITDSTLMTNLAWATVETANKPAGEFAYGTLTNSIILQANNTYAILSYEEGGGDYWHNNATIASHDIALNVQAVKEGPEYVIFSTNSSFVPVDLHYRANASSAVQNYAMWVNNSDLTIQGKGTNEVGGTTLAAYNRDTTILFFGSNGAGAPNGSRAVTNILVQNLKFEGKPTVDYTGATNPKGIVTEDCGVGNIGSLLALGGARGATNGSITNSLNLVVRDCLFYNPSSIGIYLSYAKDVLVTNCSFSYFNGIDVALAKSLQGWCGILSQSASVQDVAVLNCHFNGNVQSTNSTDYATDGLVWLQSGGKWIVDGCQIRNYGLEAVQFNAGPFTVSGNTFETANRPSSTSLLSVSDYTDSSTNNLLSLITPCSIYSVGCYANNTVTGGAGGVTGPVPGRSDFGRSPYNLVLSANRFDLPGPITVGTNIYATTCMQMAYIQAVTASGNKVDSGGYGFFYSHYDTDPNSSSTFDLRVLCNDFSMITGSSFLLQDNPNRMRRAWFTANKLGGSGYGHLNLGVPSNPAVKPTNWLQGNQFWWNGKCPLADGVTTSAAMYNSFSGWLGMAFTVSNSDLMVNCLGRWVISGSTNIHTVKIVRASDGADIASASVNTAGQPPGRFAYAELAGGSQVILLANTSYYLVSSESIGGDSWIPFCAMSTFANNGVTVTGSTFKYGNNPFVIQQAGSYSYGPLSFTGCKLVNRVGSNWNPNAGSNLGTNATGQYIINNPSEFSDDRFSLY